ncbi:MAG TPA: hypothetical protein VFR70_00720 [Flavobacterium sp.]|nr:hypothetical protein [Flavobacterium sp.]
MKNAVLFLLFSLLTAKVFSQGYNKTQIDSILAIAEQLENTDSEYGAVLGLKAYEHSKKISYSIGMAEGLLIAARKQHDSGRFEEVLKNACKAQKISVSIPDSRYLADALRLKGVGYTGLGFFDKGYAELKQAVKIAKALPGKTARSSRVGVLYNDIANNLKQGGESLDSITYYYRKGYKEFESIELNGRLKNKALALACSNLGYSFMKTNKIDSAETYLDRALVLSDIAGHDAVKVNILDGLGQLFFIKKEYELSINYFKRGVGIAKSLKNPYLLKSLYMGLSKSYEAYGDDFKAKDYLSDYAALSDSLSRIEKLALATPINNIIQENQQTHEAREYSLRLIIIYTFVFSALLIIILLYIYKKNKAQHKHSIVSQEDIKKEDDVQNTEDAICLRELVRLAALDDPLFLPSFKSAYPDFYAKLDAISPSLITAEHKLCAFLKLDFSTKEIAQIANLSVRSVQAKKYRLRKKLGIPQEDDINIWMMNL